MDFILITLISGGLSILNPPNQVARMQMNADTTTDEFNANLDPKVKTVSSQYYVWMRLIPTPLSNVKAVPKLIERRNETWQRLVFLNTKLEFHDGTREILCKRFCSTHSYVRKHYVYACSSRILLSLCTSSSFFQSIRRQFLSLDLQQLRPLPTFIMSRVR